MPIQTDEGICPLTIFDTSLCILASIFSYIDIVLTIIPFSKAFVISFFFAIALWISVGIFFIFNDNDLIITASVILPIFYLLSLCFLIIGFKRKKRDSNLRGKFLGLLSLLSMIPSTGFILFLLAYGLVGELSGGCC